ncbi:MAG: sulfite exporter TauE/SafE family protein [Methyloprofundus sp.]|nr:sulfite exporter TauE/SafE family protein [Methyloprofundus sp.]MDT8425947.1 sulfite exporter TauE/SafE family protein [Methyloprofundus sp.]
MLDIVLICLVFGGFSGILAGLFGIGGGLVLVPFFALLFERQGIAGELIMLMAVATSLATMIVTSIAAVLAHQRLGAVIWPYVWQLSGGVVVGVVAGAYAAYYLLSVNLRLIFALYMVYVAIQMVMQLRPEVAVQTKKLTSQVLGLSGLAIGFASAVLGIGGGSLTVPFLARFHVPMRNAVAVSSACGLPIALAGSISYALLGWQKVGLPVGSFGYVYLPAFVGVVLSSMLFAPIGAKWANSLPTKKLKQYFSILLFIVAGKLLWPFIN